MSSNQYEGPIITGATGNRAEGVATFLRLAGGEPVEVYVGGELVVAGVLDKDEPVRGARDQATVRVHPWDDEGTGDDVLAEVVEVRLDQDREVRITSQ